MFNTGAWDVAIEAMLALQQAAVKVDAEPGMSAGLHVHVARPRGDELGARAFLAFLLWEQALTRLAQGRFAHLRDMNRPVAGDLVGFLSDVGIVSAWGFDGNFDSVTDYCEDLRRRMADNANLWTEADDMHGFHYEVDRHSHLSVNTRFQTWEFRIWNSTRSAWRIEMACRLAVAWVQPGFIDTLLAFDGERTPAALARLVSEDWQGDDYLAALLHRQVDYLPTAGAAPAAFAVA